MSIIEDIRWRVHGLMRRWSHVRVMNKEVCSLDFQIDRYIFTEQERREEEFLLSYLYSQYRNQERTERFWRKIDLLFLTKILIKKTSWVKKMCESMFVEISDLIHVRSVSIMTRVLVLFFIQTKGATMSWIIIRPEVQDLDLSVEVNT
jgi:hypothetical protein